VTTVVDLAIAPLLPKIGAALATVPRLVLEAPPGAGKTTGVPLALVDDTWLGGRTILLLEPRRIAARAAAARMAALRGEALGETVGYRTRLDSRVGPKTRIEVVTEGILTRRIQSDPELAGVGLVIFDEFHERRLVADLGLALTLDTAKALRPDLRLLVMSATLDGSATARLLADAPILRAEGRAFPVETRHLPAPVAGNLIPAVASAIRWALSETEGDVLAFLPGEREIRAAERTLANLPGALVVPLYGALAPEAQDRVFAPAPKGRRKIVLATSIAETSLTIDGIRVVVDSGFAREPRFDPASGLTRLETVRVSQASADQRRGRAGRTAPGVAYRLWPEAATKGLAPRATPEILQADLAPLALELAQWGVIDPTVLAWLDPPPAASYAEARALLTDLGALDRGGRLTAHGRAMARLPLHPRLAHMVIVAQTLGLASEAASLAALMTERDILAGPAAAQDADLRLRVDALQSPGIALPAGVSVRDGTRRRVLAAARQIRSLIGANEQKRTPRTEALGLLVALAYPDRIAQARGGGGFRMANGRGAILNTGDPLAREDWLAIAEVAGGDKDARVFLAAPVSRADIEEHFATSIKLRECIEWNPRTEAVDARRQRRFGALVLDDAHWSGAPRERIAASLLTGVRSLGLGILPWTDAARQLQARVVFLAALDGDGAWPDLSDATLTTSLDDWLLPYLAGKRRRADLSTLDLAAIFGDRLSWEQRRRLETEAPSAFRLPGGRSVTLDYAGGEAPILAAKVQELFGMVDTPRIGNGRVPLTLHILSPAGRPVQVTRDLAGFWKGSYADVRKDLRGRYPKHRWPDDPAHAEPIDPARPRR
jgi:ATP-dependent helicase HrpB